MKGQKMIRESAISTIVVILHLPMLMTKSRRSFHFCWSQPLRNLISHEFLFFPFGRSPEYDDKLHPAAELIRRLAVLRSTEDLNCCCSQVYSEPGW